MDQRRSLRKFLIYPKFQLLLIGTNAAIIVAAVVIFWVTTFNALGDLAPAAGLSGINVEYYKKFLDYQTTQLTRAFFVAILLSLTLSCGITIFISHRMAGPLVRLRGFLRTLIDNDGQSAPLTFRDGDYLSDLPELVNRAVEAVAKSKKKGRDAG